MLLDLLLCDGLLSIFEPILNQFHGNGILEETTNRIEAIFFLRQCTTFQTQCLLWP